ncbi:hypothetical protein NON00_22365 [Roseomonas sp. GC11]|uniref:hypothetical protein n=1 Tax=Roseomonas sp. GC11 TaxID=2950546 RepID=UPI00210B338D|nr:hypothetical protein [Roseomonas sp. GC11]MCQ4162656.1 hypothetical protein [Roseomonas sp. GC11]
MTDSSSTPPPAARQGEISVADLAALLKRSEEEFTAPRDRLIHDLGILANFLERLPDLTGACRRAAERLIPLSLQLEGLNGGQVGPLLSQQRQTGRPAISVQDRETTLNAALLMEAWHQQGLTRPQAAAKVARTLGARGLHVGGEKPRPITAGMVQRWRDDFEAGPKPGQEADQFDRRWAEWQAQQQAQKVFLRPDVVPFLLEGLLREAGNAGIQINPPD